MKPPAFRRLHPPSSPRNRERGITMLLVAVALVTIIGMAALSIDLVTLYLAKEEAQRSADSAALAAARVISISGITGAADPATDTSFWQKICGGSTSAATQAAQAVAGQNAVGGSAGTVTVTYSAGGFGPAADCSSGLPQAFAVNPLVTVKVQRSMPSFFSRIWGNTGSSISATAVAEAFNPSASDLNNNGGTTGVVPVEPRCVKPWIVPNLDPGSSASFVSTGNGAITTPGISSSTSTGVIGEIFTLFADCGAATPCQTPDPLPRINVPTTGGNKYNGNSAPAGNNLQYLPGEVPATSVAVPSCGNGTPYQAAVAGCDQNTVYECGILKGNVVDLSENPGSGLGDTATALACSLGSQTSVPIAGLDALDPSSYPYRITAGTANPYKIVANTSITSSNSIVTLPIYDQTAVTIGAGNTQVTIVGFLQVFINSVDANGTVNVTVLNVAGCGSSTPNLPVTGSSPVPVRLVTPP